MILERSALPPTKIKKKYREYSERLRLETGEPPVCSDEVDMRGSVRGETPRHRPKQTNSRRKEKLIPS